MRRNGEESPSGTSPNKKRMAAEKEEKENEKRIPPRLALF
nr:MAG TPA: hypothetical protein [Caudoviricetes sp.]